MNPKPQSQIKREAMELLSVAQTIARSITVVAQRTDALRAIAEAQAATGDIDGAIASAMSIDEPSDRGGVLRKLTEARANADDIDGALVIIAQSSDHPHERTTALRKLTEARANAGDINGALVIARSIDGLYERVEALCTIARAHRRLPATLAARRAPSPRQ